MSNTNFPSAIDSFYDPNNSTDTMASVPHNIQHGQANDAVTAVETKIGTGASTPSTGTFFMGTGTGASAWTSSPVSPSFTTSIKDTNGNTWLGQTPTASAVDYVNVTNAATGGTPAVGSKGSDTNIDLNITSQGSGKVRENGSSMLDFRSSFSNFIQSGGVWTQNSGLVGSMTAMQLWINGVEYNQVLVSNHTFGASVDTYIDYTVGTGITYTAVANNASSPALASNSVRIAIVVTSGVAITTINQGSTTASAPVISSRTLAVSDTNGNLIYPSTPQPIILGYAQVTSNPSNVTSVTAAAIAGLSTVIIAPGNGRKIEITLFIPFAQAGGTLTSGMSIWDGVVGSGTKIGEQDFTIQSSGYAGYNIPAVPPSPTGVKTYNAGGAVSTNALTINAATGNPAYIMVKAI